MPVVTAAVFIGLGPGAASASACVGWTVTKPPSPGSVSNTLSGAAATSATNTWAVGSYSNGGVEKGRTLIVRWNGSSWKQQSTPNPGSGLNSLLGVAATSSANAWAVGSYDNGLNTSAQTLIERWNGSSWKQVTSPSPGGSGSGHASVLNGVTAISATNAWAVGYYVSTTTHRITTLIEHWNGTAWKQQSSPNPGSPISDNQLNAIAATSATDAWAVGATGESQEAQALIFHWNGTAWKQVPNPSNDSNILSDVAATSSADAWAVGSTCISCGTEGQVTDTLTEHWKGTTWKQVPSPSPSNFNNVLSGVAATSATNAWAVGSNGTTLIARWNGTAWKQQSSPNPGTRATFLDGVAAISATSAWAVGSYTNGRTSHTLALHGC